MAWSVRLAYLFFYLGIAFALFPLPFEAYFFLSLGTAFLPLSLFLLALHKEIDFHYFPSTTKRTALFLFLSTLLTCISAFYSTNVAEAIRKVQMKLPFFFLLLPFWFAPMKLNRKLLRLLLHLFFLLLLVIVSISLINALGFHYEATLETLRRSGTIPFLTPISHIYFSSMLGFSIFLTYFFARTRDAEIWKLPSGYYTGMIVLQVGMLLLFLSRTGLVSFFLTFFLIFLLFERKWGWGKRLALLLMGIALPFLFYFLYPPLQVKVANTIEDLSFYTLSHPCVTDYSLAQRLAAFEITWGMIQGSPWWGYGIGDVQSVFEIAASQSRFETADIVLPHHQFALTWLQAGLLPLLCLIAFFLYGFLQHRKTFLPTAFYLFFFFVFQVEYFLERQVGITFFLLMFFLSHDFALQKENR